MSTIKVDTIKTTSNVEVFTAKAWVNFDGTTNTGGSCTIRASGNVSSVTDNSAGVYTVNFANAMPDVNYSVIGSSRETATGNRNFQPLPDITNTVSAVKISTIIGSTGAVADSQYIYVAVFR